MVNRIKEHYEEIAAYMDDILQYLENDRAFSLLNRKKPEKEQIYKLNLKFKLGKEPSQEELLQEGKKVVDIFDIKDKILELINEYGSTRKEILKNLGYEIIGSTVLTNAYLDSLGAKSSQIDFSINRERFGRGRQLEMSLYDKLEIERVDSKYFNIYGGAN